MIQHSFKMNEHEKFKGAETKAEPRQIWCDPFLLLTHLSAASSWNAFISVQPIPALMFFGVLRAAITLCLCHGAKLPWPNLQIQLILLQNSKWVKRFPSKNSRLNCWLGSVVFWVVLSTGIF